MKDRFFYIILLFGFIGFSQENPVSISTDTTAIQIGEQIQLKITVNEIDSVVFPKLKLDSLGLIEVVEALPADTLKNTLEKKYVLTSFDSGQYVIPKQHILIKNKNYFTDELLVNVATVKVDTAKQKMYEIKSIRREPKILKDYIHLWWLIIPILVVLTVILYFVFRKRKEKQEVKVYIAPIKEALQRLKELDEKQLLQQNKIKAYYSELTNIVRTYIEKDIKIPALESTTNELIETIIDFNQSSNLGISKETVQQLKEVLQKADLVKFAKSKPVVEEIRGDRLTAETILNDTQHAVHLHDVVEDETMESISANEASLKTIQKKKKNSKLIYILAIAVVIITGLGFAGYVGYRYVKNEFIGNTSLEMAEKDWFTATYGYPEISLETPEILEVQSVQMPENTLSSIGEFTGYSYESPISNFYITVATIHFLSELDEFDQDNGLQGSLDQFEVNLKTKLTNVQKSELVVNSISGKRADAYYIKKDSLTGKSTKSKLTMLLFSDTKGMRQVTISHLKNDKSAEKVSERIIKSVTLNP